MLWPALVGWCLFLLLVVCERWTGKRCWDLGEVSSSATLLLAVGWIVWANRKCKLPTEALGRYARSA